jgi:hypothetical protein
MRAVLADSVTELLQKLPREEQLQEMRECERLLWEAGIDPGSPRRDSPQKFSDDLFLANPEVLPLVQQAMRYQEANKSWDPTKLDEPPTAVVCRLLPSDGHME